MFLSYNGSELKGIFTQTLATLDIRQKKTTAQSQNQNWKVKMSYHLIRKVHKQFFFSFNKSCKIDLPFNKLQILTTLTCNIVNSQPTTKAHSRENYCIVVYAILLNLKQ